MQLSLIIPVYKVEQYIEDCLRSILHQIKNRKDVEIIIVNDGTPDNSMKVIDNLVKNENNIIIINQSNQGLSIARNIGLKKSQGKYVWFIDSDDWLLPNAIDDLLYNINNHPDIAVFSTILEYHFEKTNKTEQEYYPVKTELTGKEYLQLKYKQGASQRFIFKKSFLEKYDLSFYPKILHEDGLFGYKMLYWADKIKILKKSVYAYRIREEGSIMSSISMKTPIDLLFIHKKLIEFNNTQVISVDKQWYRLSIFNILLNIFQFSKGLAFKSEFKNFYKANRTYINKEIDYILQHKTIISKSLYFETIIIKYFPLGFMKLKYIANIIKKRWNLEK